MADNASPAPNAQQSREDQHEHDIEEREAYQYWGYLFKADKTGTDRLKSLLRGLKELMNTNYEPSDNPDLTPTQLAYFYRELHGNYEQLFLGTPNGSIAFIYKSLGCLHSLQPQPQSTAFTEPTVPALKTEGWIMWQTIQLLLAPEEHSGFLREAIQKWDVRDPMTGEVFPKILPRQCFPMEPDKHMVAWYEGVSERLRREAEDEERQREIEAEQAEVRRIQFRKQREDEEENTSVDSRGPAMAYFRNPLYRQDGRPTIVRRNSKRPQLSPRRSSIKDKAKDGATSVGHVIRNIGSPHLWDGRGGSKSESRERSKDRRRRSSLPDSRHHHSTDRPPSSHRDSRTSSYASSHHHRPRSAQPLQQQQQQPPPEADASGGDEGWSGDDEEDNAPLSTSESRNSQTQPDNDPALRHSRSHEPTPSQKEYGDYFEGYDDANQQASSTSANVTPNGIGPSFAPSASPLFASHVAKQPQPQTGGRAPADYTPPRTVPEFRRAQQGSGNSGGRPYSRSPDASLRPRDDRRYASRERRRFDQSPGRVSPPRSTPSVQQSRFPPVGGAGGPLDSSRRSSNTPPYPTSGQGFPPYGPGSGGDRERRGSARLSVSDAGGLSGADDPRRNASPKRARFAQGVDGRRYPNESAWRS